MAIKSGFHRKSQLTPDKKCEENPRAIQIAQVKLVKRETAPTSDSAQFILAWRSGEVPTLCQGKPLLDSDQWVPSSALYRLELKRPSPQARHSTTKSSAVSGVTSVWVYQIAPPHGKGNSAQPCAPAVQSIPKQQHPSSPTSGSEGARFCPSGPALCLHSVHCTCFPYI